MTKYLITGIGGFVARHLLDHLGTLETPVEVLGVDRGIGGRDFETERCRCRLISVDLRDPDVFDVLVSEFQPRHIVHLAARSSVADSWRQPMPCLTDNLGMLLNLLEALRKEKQRNPTFDCRALIVGSSEVYRPCDGKPLREEARREPENPYGVGRLAQEELIRLYIRQFGLEIVSTRSFMHIGSGQSEQFAVASFVRQLVDARKAGKPRATLKTGNIDLWRDISDVRDVVRAYRLLLEKGGSGEVYNVCRGEAVLLGEVIRMAANLLKIEAEIEIDPRRLRPGEVEKVLGCNEKLRRQTGWSPEFSLKQTLTTMVENVLSGRQ